MIHFHFDTQTENDTVSVTVSH